MPTQAAGLALTPALTCSLLAASLGDPVATALLGLLEMSRWGWGLGEAVPN